MATIKVKFLPSESAEKEGMIYYQIIHARKIRKILTKKPRTERATAM